MKTEVRKSYSRSAAWGPAARCRPLPLAEARSGLGGRAGPAPPSLQSRAFSVASPAQGGAGKTGVWLRLVRGTWLCRVPVKVKDTFLNSGLELFNHSILKSKYFLWHFDSWTALKFRNSSPKRNTKNCSELGGSRTLKSFYLLRACVCAVGNCELSSLGRSSETAWFVPREDALAFPGVCVSVTETEITWRRVTSTGVLSARFGSRVGWFCCREKTQPPLGLVLLSDVLLWTSVR